jgi:hypothetical protein
MEHYNHNNNVWMSHTGATIYDKHSILIAYVSQLMITLMDIAAYYYTL